MTYNCSSVILLLILQETHQLMLAGIKVFCHQVQPSQIQHHLCKGHRKINHTDNGICLHVLQYLYKAHTIWMNWLSLVSIPCCHFHCRPEPLYRTWWLSRNLFVLLLVLPLSHKYWKNTETKQKSINWNHNNFSVYQFHSKKYRSKVLLWSQLFLLADSIWLLNLNTLQNSIKWTYK